jgi:hypothetical protein
MTPAGGQLSAILLHLRAVCRQFGPFVHLPDSFVGEPWSIAGKPDPSAGKPVPVDRELTPANRAMRFWDLHSGESHGVPIVDRGDVGPAGGADRSQRRARSVPRRPRGVPPRPARLLRGGIGPAHPSVDARCTLRPWKSLGSWPGYSALTRRSTAFLVAASDRILEGRMASPLAIAPGPPGRSRRPPGRG